MYLGLDIGTSAVKAVILDEDGALLAEASAPLNVQRPQPGWSEQDPEAWWQAANLAVTALPSALRASVVAVGLSGQMHGATLLGRDDRPLRPAILWNDGRSQAECRTLEAREPRTRSLTGNAAMPGFTAPKLVWLKAHEPEVFAATAKVLLPKDYVRLKMTGDHATDLSDASGTLWLDVGRRAWSGDMLAACDLGLSHMPTVHEGSSLTGRLRPEVAEAWGMEAVPVAAGAGDNAAGAIGVGVIQPGQAFLSLGTSGVIFVAGERFAPAPDKGAHAFCHALPDRWHQMSVMLSAASCLDWVARLTGFADVAAAMTAAQQRPAFAGPETFLPYLAGERTPHNDPGARGAFVHLGFDSDPAALVRAVLEGVAFGLAEGLDVLVASGAVIDQFAVIGGGSRSRYWGQILANALGRPMVYGADSHVGPALGAARLAQMALTGAAAERVCPPPRTEFIIAPDPGLADQVGERRATFAALYPALASART